MNIEVDVTVDSAAWVRALDDLLARLEDASRDASLEGAEEIQKVTRGRLSELSHHELDWGAPPGGPPAKVSGDLFASIEARMIGDEAWVGPTAGFGRVEHYARIQELGGEMHGNPFMIFYKWDADFGIVRHERSFIELWPRPYLEPSTRDVVDSGRLRSIYIEHWAAVLGGN